MLLNGQVEETVRAPDGTWPVVRKVVAGHCVGLDSVLAGQASATQVTSVTAASFVRVPVLDLQRLLRGTGTASVKLLAALHRELGVDLRAATVEMVEWMT